MVGESYRLVRLLDNDCPSSFDYLEFFDDQEFRFTDNACEALLFSTWQAFVDAAAAVLGSQGPVDVFYERVYVLS